MAYNWNKMETITVPVGLNGWLYSGQITINGVTTKFPVGVETSLPEPVAAMIKQMIAVEEGDKVAKPDNSYVGNVTIPEGKVLRLEKGAMVEDEAGVLGTASGGTSTVVVLEETTLTGEGELALGTPFNVQPEAGKTYKVTYNGTPYDCPGVETDLGGGIMGVLLGNAELAGGSGGNTEAPFTIVVVPPAFVDQMGAYAAIYDTSGATSVTLSITQEVAASGSIPTTTEPNMHLVTDADGKMTWEAKDGGEVVVLEETTVTGEAGEIQMTTPLNADPEAGKVYEVTYNGTVYECNTAKADAMIAMGKLSELGLPDGNEDAPFIVLLVPSDKVEELGGMTGGIMDATGASSVTLSIVDTGKTVPKDTSPYIVTGTPIYEDGNATGATLDKTYTEVMAAINAGRSAVVHLTFSDGGVVMLQLVSYDSTAIHFTAVIRISEMTVYWGVGLASDDTVTLYT